MCKSAPGRLHSPVRSFRGCHGYLWKRKLRSTLPPPTFIKIHVIDWLVWYLQTPPPSPQPHTYFAGLPEGESDRAEIQLCRPAVTHRQQPIMENKPCQGPPLVHVVYERLLAAP